MNMDDDHQRAISDKIERLRRRLKDVRDPNLTPQQLRAVLLGILDLLGDEL